MPERINFTIQNLNGIPPAPPGKRTTVWDSRTRGLCVRVTATGSKSFYHYRKHNGKPTFEHLGPFAPPGGLTVDQARQRADAINGQMALGKRQAGGPTGDTFGELFTWYFKHHAEKHKATAKADQQDFDKYLAAWKDRPASSISKGDVRELHTRIGKAHPYRANRILSLVRVIYNKAIKGDVYEGGNPAVGIERYHEQSRDRRLTETEFPHFYRAVTEEPNETLRDFVLMSLYTGARQANVLAMRWDEVDLDGATWRIPKTKNKTPQVVPLEALELDLLRERKAARDAAHAADLEQDPPKAGEKREPNPWVFPAATRTGHLLDPDRGWKQILARAAIDCSSLATLRMHDLRRTLGSWMADTGATLAVVGQALNHKHAATTQIYARLSQGPVRKAKRTAHEAIQEAIQGG